MLFHFLLTVHSFLFSSSILFHYMFPLGVSSFITFISFPFYFSLFRFFTSPSFFSHMFYKPFAILFFNNIFYSFILFHYLFPLCVSSFITFIFFLFYFSLSPFLTSSSFFSCMLYNLPQVTNYSGLAYGALCCLQPQKKSREFC
jgi:hypothetical protein